MWQCLARGLLYMGNSKRARVGKATGVRVGVRKVAKARSWVTLSAVVGTWSVPTLREGCVEVTSADPDGQRVGWSAMWKME